MILIFEQKQWKTKLYIYKKKRAFIVPDGPDICSLKSPRSKKKMKKSGIFRENQKRFYFENATSILPDDWS